MVATMGTGRKLAVSARECGICGGELQVSWKLGGIASSTAASVHCGLDQEVQDLQAAESCRGPAHCNHARCAAAHPQVSAALWRRHRVGGIGIRVLQAGLLSVITQRGAKMRVRPGRRGGRGGGQGGGKVVGPSNSADSMQVQRAPLPWTHVLLQSLGVGSSIFRWAAGSSGGDCMLVAHASAYSPAGHAAPGGEAGPRSGAVQATGLQAHLPRPGAGLNIVAALFCCCFLMGRCMLKEQGPAVHLPEIGPQAGQDSVTQPTQWC